MTHTHGQSPPQQVVGDMTALADFILHDIDDDRHVVVGPQLWQPSDGANSRRWYFMVGTSEKARGFRCYRVDDSEDGSTRHELTAALCQRRPLVVHLVDDTELYMAKLCEALWPCERTTWIRATVEAEVGVAAP